MREDQKNSQKLLIGIIGALVVLTVIFLGYPRLFPTQNEALPVPQEDLAQKKVIPKKSEAISSDESDNFGKEAPIQMIKEDVLKEPLPENEALAKEEVAKLEDIQAQLIEQENTLNAQHDDADKLIKLKEEQIKLLEAQLAASK